MTYKPATHATRLSATLEPTYANPDTPKPSERHTVATLKALTLHQPWATLIALGIKHIETRSWAAPASLIGQRIAIHAGKKKPKPVWHTNLNRDPVFPPQLEWLYERELCCDPWETSDGQAWCYPWTGPLGCVVATATLEACLPIFDRFGSFATDENPLWAYAQDHGWVISNLRNQHLGSPLLQVLRPPVIGQRTGWGQLTIDEQLPYGDYSTDKPRWAWMLTDIEPLAEPIPAKGFQRLWNWEVPE